MCSHDSPTVEPCILMVHLHENYVFALFSYKGLIFSHSCLTEESCVLMIHLQ